MQLSFRIEIWKYLKEKGTKIHKIKANKTQTNSIRWDSKMAYISINNLSPPDLALTI